MDALFPGATLKVLSQRDVGLLYNAGVADEGEVHYAGTTHDKPLLYCGTKPEVADAYGNSAAFRHGAQARVRTFRLVRDINAIWVRADNCFMTEEEEGFLLNHNDIDAVAQYDSDANLTELCVKPACVERVADFAKVWRGAFVDASTSNSRRLPRRTSFGRMG